MSDGPEGASPGSDPGRTGRVGWFLGVYAPTLAAMLGVVVFLRLGPIVASAGVLGAMGVVALGSAIAVLTALSTSALATNMRLGPGGAYFLVSRSFGLEVGGAIGIPLYLSQATAITWAAFAGAELLGLVWTGVPVLPVAGLLVVALIGASSTGVRFHPMARIGFLGAVAVAVGATIAGIGLGGPRVDLLGAWEPLGFWACFALYFPAMTSILTGVSSSEDLEDPEHAIPQGALTAAITGACVYLVLPGLFANGADASVLAQPLGWARFAAAPALVGLCAVVAVVGTAWASVKAAPRTLQALAMDRLVPAGFAHEGPGGESRWGHGATAVIAVLALLAGSLDGISSVVSALFLTTFGVLNLVAGLEGLVGDTSYRPRVRVHWALCLGASAACLLATTAISPAFALMAVSAELVVMWTLSRRSLQATFGDARTGLLLSAARWALLRLRTARQDARNWRPHVLVFTTDLHRTLPVVKWADRFGQHRGIVTVIHLLHGATTEDAASLLRTDASMLRSAGITAFSDVIAVPDLDRGVVTVAQANGTAGLQANTVMLGMHLADDGPEHLARLQRLAADLAAVERCTVIHSPSITGIAPSGPPRFVVWWVGRQNHGDLMLLLAHLARSTREFRRARIELKSVAHDPAEARELQRDYEGMLPTVRVEVHLEVLVRAEGETVHDVIARESAGAILVFLGLSLPVAGQEMARAATLDALLRRLPDTCLVHNAGPFRGRLV